jgi:GMP synthase-like glutamine amidotransferase
MRTLILQHTPEENPGTLTTWLEQVRFPYHVFHFYQDEHNPTAEAYDWLIVLGGPMNLDDLENHPWLAREKEFIRSWLGTGKPYLGLCLGGQLLSQALGGEVKKNSQREIGFHQVARTGKDHPALARWPHELSVFQWHEDTFSIPEGSRLLFTNETCETQAFAVGNHLFGFQFHPESTETWIRSCYEDFAAQEGEEKVKPLAITAAEMPRDLPVMTKHFHNFLEDFVQNV